jgi:phage baseplate assembly protein W
MATDTTHQPREIYSDFRANFDPHPVKGDLLRLTNEEAVKRSIRNILLTEPYERFTNFEFGAGLANYLFENISTVTEGQIKSAIETSIKNYEKRANLISVVVSARPDDDAYAATIIFSVINQIEPVTLKVLLERIR